MFAFLLYFLIEPIDMKEVTVLIRIDLFRIKTDINEIKKFENAVR